MAGVAAPAAHSAPTLHLTNIGGPVIETSLAGTDDAADLPLVGDWDGDGDVNLGLYNSSGSTTPRYRLNRENTASSGIYLAGTAGNPGDVLVGGRWNTGTSKDTLAVWRPNQWVLYTPTSAGGPFGPAVPIGSPPGTSREAGDQPVFGDWDNDKVDTIGLWRRSTNSLWISNSNTNISYQLRVAGLGNFNDKPVIADWNNDGTDSLALWRPVSNTAIGGGNASFFGANAAHDYGLEVQFGTSAGIPIAGDWDHDSARTQTIGIYYPSLRAFYPSRSNTSPDLTDQFKLTALKAEDSDKIISADWDGDGKDSPAAYRSYNGTVYYGNDAQSPTHNVLATGINAGDNVVGGRWNSALNRDVIATWNQASWTFRFPNYQTNDIRTVAMQGTPTQDTPLFGDWDGDGVDTIGLWNRPTRSFYASNSNTAPSYPTTPTIDRLGSDGDIPVVGDWNKDGKDTVALYHQMPGSGQQWFGANTSDNYALATLFGDPGDKPIAGDWDGDGYDTIGVSRTPPPPPQPEQPDPNPPITTAVPMLKNQASCGNAQIRSDSSYGISLGPDAKKILDKYKTQFDNVVDCMKLAMGNRAPILRFQLPIDAFRRDSTGYKSPSPGYDGVRGGTEQLAAFKTLLGKTGGVGVISIMGSWFESCSANTILRQSTWSEPLGTCGYPNQPLYRQLFADIKQRVDSAGFVSSGIFYTAWNEPDHDAFTLRWAAGSNDAGARLAGKFWAHAAQVAGAGQVLAGEFSSSNSSRVSQFMAGVSEATDLVGARPAPKAGRWALHTYDPSPTSKIGTWENLEQSQGTKLGTAWMTEIGQYRSDAGTPQGSWNYGDALRTRAMNSASKLMMYHLVPPVNAQDTHDSALLDGTGQARPVLCGLAALAKEDCGGSL